MPMRISTDVLQGLGSQHATEVEPSAATDGTTIVAAFQEGRDLVSGAEAIGYATSRDGGLTWFTGILPGITRASGGVFDSASDAVAAYDAFHHMWLIASIPIANEIVPHPVVSRSVDGLHWSPPVAVGSGDSSDDKEWIVCDNALASAYRGRCYMEWDDAGSNGIVHMSTSTDGGATWARSAQTLDGATGVGGQPLVAPNGTVFVPIDGFNADRIVAFLSHDGGTTWSASVPVATIVDHFQAGSLRSGPLVSAALDATGRVYAVWQDCRFRTNCSQDDLVLSVSSDGLSWSAPSRIPIDGLTSTTDHFIPGVTIDPTTSGPSAHIALTYYYYPSSACTACQLYVGFIASSDGGITWGAAETIDGPIPPEWLAKTTQGRMASDYASTIFVGREPRSIFAAAHSPQGGIFDEAVYATSIGELRIESATRRSSFGERAIPGAHSDHAPRREPQPPIHL
jgi:hypothetical protein